MEGKGEGGRGKIWLTYSGELRSTCSRGGGGVRAKKKETCTYILYMNRLFHVGVFLSSNQNLKMNELFFGLS
jgi:hypothetical protein